MVKSTLQLALPRDPDLVTDRGPVWAESRVWAESA